MYYCSTVAQLVCKYTKFMNTPDIILLLLVLIPGTITGLRKGFIYQVITVLAVWLGALISYQFARPFGDYLGEIIKLPANVVNVIAFILTFIVVYFVLHLLGMILRKIIKDIVGGGTDKVLGVILGIFKQALIIGLLIIVFDTINSKIVIVNRETLDESGVYGWLHDFAKAVFPFLKNLVINGIAH